MIVLLKKLTEDENIIDIAKFQLTVNMYSKQLQEKGWIYNQLEGGIISPDLSTIFYTDREPYIGQLVQFRPNAKIQYEKVLNDLKDDFEILEKEI